MHRNNSFLAALLKDFFGEEPFKASYEEKAIEKETIEFTKGSYHTRIDIHFNKNGYPVGYSADVEYIPTEAEKDENQLQLLQKELEEAKELEDYSKCAEIKRKIDELKNPFKETNTLKNKTN